MTKWAIMNNLDVNGSNPYSGISMDLHDNGEEALYKRFKRLVDEKQDKIDINKKIRSCMNDPLVLNDGYEIPVLHVYYYRENEPDRQIHSVFTAWPVEV